MLLEVNKVYVPLVPESEFEAEKTLDISELDFETLGCSDADPETSVAVTDNETVEIISVKSTEVI
jgi:hypothetical protein